MSSVFQSAPSVAKGNIEKSRAGVERSTTGTDAAVNSNVGFTKLRSAATVIGTVDSIVKVPWKAPGELNGVSSTNCASWLFGEIVAMPRATSWPSEFVKKNET